MSRPIGFKHSEETKRKIRLNGGRKKTPPVDRFWPKVIKTKTCWIWKGAFRGDYGVIGVNKKGCSTHRFSWQIHFGKIPNGKLVLHKCDNPSCVNPNHLFLGSQSENCADMVRKGRQNVGEKNKQSKLKEFEVIEIKELIGIPQKVIAEAYRVSPSTIFFIHSGKNWSYLVSTT